MAEARLVLALLPAAATVLTAIAVRPKGEAVAPVRLAIVRAALIIGALAILTIELLSTVDGIRTGPVIVFWVLVTAVSAVLAVRRGMPRIALPDWRSWTRAEQGTALALGLLVVAELVLAVVAFPNNYDSYYYHLSKVEHWVADHNVGVYATVQVQQVAFAPGGEYLLLHLRLLTGGDGAYNLVQWGAGLGAGLAVSRIAARFGVGRLGQLLGAAAFMTAPMVVLEATSTQTDLIVTAWVTCAATLTVDGLRRRATPAEVLGLGAAAGLSAVTKSTGLMVMAAVLLLWGIAQLRLGRSGWLRTAGASLAIVVLGLVVFGPFMVRMQTTFGGPLGPPEYNKGLSMQRHDPAALLVNGLRIVASTVVVPAPPVNKAVAEAVITVSHAIGVDPQDPRITLASATYPDPRWKPDEDHAPFPVQSVLLLAAVVVALVTRRAPGPVRAYAGAVLLALLLTVGVLKWQEWGNRLVLPVLAAGAPLVGWWLESALNAKRWRKAIAAVVAVVVGVAFAGAYVSVAVGQPRPLVGKYSVFTTDEWAQRFARNRNREVLYEAAAERLRASGAHRIGVVVRGDQWEYPFWVMLPGRDFVAMESLVPDHPPTPPTEVDAIVCVSPDWLCRAIVPKDWKYEQFDNLVAVGTRP
jgi:hypothetical protein